MTDSKLPITFYHSAHRPEIQVRIEDDTIRLNQEQIGQVFDVNRQAITKHINNIHLLWELDKHSVSSILEHTAAGGKKYQVKFYNLDMVISVWYGVNPTIAFLKDSIEHMELSDDELSSTNHLILSYTSTCVSFYQYDTWVFQEQETTTDLFAQSNPRDKDLMIELVSHMLSKN
jgi:hypothetical protein